MHSGSQLIAKDAADAKTLANSTFQRPGSNGRRPGPGLENPVGPYGKNHIYVYIYIYIYIYIEFHKCE